MIRLPPRSTRTDTLFPYTTLFRSGQTQVVSADGSVARGRTADGERAPTYEKVRAFKHVPCSTPRAVGSSPLQIGYPDELACLVTLVSRTPYVDGLGWAEPGREFLLVEVKMPRSEEHTSELQSLMRISYAVFCLKKKNTNMTLHTTES